MGRENSSVDWELDVYSQGKQLNHWPFSDVVSAFYLERALWDKAWQPRVLEVGCGAGNNLWALAELGFQCYGIDISQSAISYGTKRLEDLGLEVNLLEGTMINLPFEDKFFDFVLDRAAVTQVARDEVSKCLHEVHRTMKVGGKLYSFGLFGDDHSDREFGQLQSNGSYDNFSQGVFARVGLTSFFSESELQSLFTDFSNLEITRNSKERLGGAKFVEYSVVATRTRSV